MGVPKHRTSKQKKRSRRSHHAISAGNISICENCKRFKRNHFVCLLCEKKTKEKSKQTKDQT